MISLTSMNILIATCVGGMFGIGLAFCLIKMQKPIKSSYSVAIIVAIILFAVTYALSNIYLPPYYTQWYLKSEIDQIPIMVTVKQYYPKEYNQLMQKLKNHIAKKDQSENMVSYSYVFANKIFLSSLKIAPDAAIHAYLRSLLEVYLYVYTRDPKLILKFERGDISVTTDLRYLSSDPAFKNMLDSAIKAKRNIIKASVESPVSPPIEIVAKSLFQSVMETLYKKYGKNSVTSAFGGQEVNEMAPELKAEIIINFYQQLLNESENNAGVIMRYIGLLSGNQ